MFARKPVDDLPDMRVKKFSFTPEGKEIFKGAMLSEVKTSFFISGLGWDDC
jgi:hypothetical protein